MPTSLPLSRRELLIGATSALAAGTLAGTVRVRLAQAQDTTTAAAPTDENAAIAQEAYIYLYPLVLMDITRKQSINTDPKVNPLGGPPNTFVNIRAYPTADMRAVVRPNFDTLYSSAWLDLTKGPVVVSHEDTGGRYFLLPMLDMWTDVFAVPGKRTSGTAAASFAVVPPGWSGELPEGVQRINAPTPFVWIIGRTQTNGPADYDAVHKVQDGYKIAPLPGAEPFVAPAIDTSVDTKTEPLKLVNDMAAADFFNYGAELMKVHAPHLTDWSTIARLKRIGLEPGKSFDLSVVGADVLTSAAASGMKLMQQQMPKLTPAVNGWQTDTGTIGVYGNDYVKRAIIAMAGLGANQPEDAIYPLNIGDADGKPVTGDGKYVLHFDKDQIPPVDAFWSLTMYDAEGFQVANPLNRFAVGSDGALKPGADGSIDIYIQHDSPGADKEANWLPSPASGNLGLTMRLYAPRPEALDGQWNPPAIKKAG